MKITDQQRRARLVNRLLFPKHNPDPEELNRELVYVHATDAPSAILHLAVRSDEIDAVDQMVDALYQKRSLSRTYAIRGSQFLVNSDMMDETFWAFTKWYAPQRRKMLLRSADEYDVTETEIDKTESLIMSLLSESDLSRSELVSGMDAPLPSWVMSQLLSAMALEGKITKSDPIHQWYGSHYLWSARGPILDLDPYEASRRILTQYVTSYGPVTYTDMKWWTGWTASDTKKTLSEMDLTEVELEDGTPAVCFGDPDSLDLDQENVTLLPALDSVSMGWKQRDFYASSEIQSKIWDSAGNATSTIWWDGEIVGWWTLYQGEPSHGFLQPVPARIQIAVRDRIDMITQQISGHYPTLGYSPLSTRYPNI